MDVGRIKLQYDSTSWKSAFSNVRSWKRYIPSEMVDSVIILLEIIRDEGETLPPNDMVTYHDDLDHDETPWIELVWYNDENRFELNIFEPYHADVIKTIDKITTSKTMQWNSTHEII